jgi:hypothetical protein
VNPDAANPAAGATGFADIAETGNSDFIYELETGAGKVNVYQIASPASPLNLVQQIGTGLPQTGGIMGIVYVQPADGREGN